MNRTLSLRKESILRLSTSGESIGLNLGAPKADHDPFFWPVPTLSTSLTTVD